MADCVWIGGDLSESAELYRLLVCNMQSGVAYCKMLFEDGKPMDFVYLMVNHAFTSQIGIDDVVGKKVTEVIKGLKVGDPEVFDRYALVALTGKPDCFEINSEPLNKWFQVSLYSHKPEHFVAILDDITERKKAEERERRSANLYHALSATNEAILKLKSTGELYPYICRIAVEHGGMSHAWIGVPDEEGRFISVGRFGRFADPSDLSRLTDPYYQITVLSTPDQPEGRGPSGIAFRENRTVVVNDIFEDERLAPWHEFARKGETRSMAAFPIIKSGRSYGIFSVYSDQPDVFDDETVALLEGMTNNLSFALDNLERETLLRESEARFRQLADSMPQLVWTANPNGGVDYYNDRLHEYKMDFTRNQAGIFEWMRIVHPDDVGASVRAWERAVKTGQTYEMEQRVLLSNGMYRWHITRAAPVRNENGEITKWFGTSTDIHELKSAQEALIDSEARFRTLFENAGDGIFIGDMVGKLIDVNASGAQMLGYSHSEVTKLKVTDILAQHERGRVPDSWEGWEVGRNAVSEWVLLRKDGSTFEGEVNSQVLPDRRFMGIVRDVTERKRMLAALEEKEQLLRLFIESAPAAIAMYDKEMRYLAASKRFIEDYHLTEDNLIGRSHYEVFPEIPERWREFHRRCLAGETIHMEEDSFVRVDGSVDWIRWEIKPWYSGDAVGGMLIFSEVITERKMIEQERAKLSEQLQLALDAANLGWWCYDPVAEIIFFDQRHEKILGLPSRQQTKEEILMRIHPDDRLGVWDKVAAALNPVDPQPYEAEYRYLMPDGSVRWLKAYGMATFKGAGRERHASSLVGTVADITSSKKAEEALMLAAAIYRDSSEAMMVLDENRNIIMVNHAFADMTGYEADDVIGQHPRFLRIGHPDEELYKEENAFYQDMWRQADENGRFKSEIWHKKKDGQFIAVQITVNVITGEAGMPRRYVVLLSDITEKKRSDDVIWNQANFDTLTGLANRRFFRDRLEHEVRNAKRSNLPLALMFIDLDGFKDVNDTLGHDMGDVLLKEAAERLYRCVRESDTVARLGGDEFTIILTELHDPGNADRVARHILKALSEPVTLGKEQAYVSASIGITLYPSDAEEVEELIRNADQAMYEAKQRGKNQYQYFTPAMQQAAIKRIRMVNDMRKALERNQFEIMYQPIVDLATGEVRKAEALIRWRHPRRGLVNPVEFISAAEDTGMITSFGDWMFHEAAKQAALWREKYHPDFQISVNISPVQFKKDGIDPAVWLEHLKSLDLSGQGIVVEITEGLLLDASPKIKDQLLMLRDAGIEVALDDFGTGYSSLAYLKKFDIDYLKIDQAFIHNLEANSDDMALCEAIIVMAHKLGLRVIAEGIETDYQRRLLAGAGCDFAQGYLFSKPVMAEEFERMVESDPY